MSSQICEGGVLAGLLGIDTRSPYIRIVHDDEPTTYAYRVCWMDRKGNKGPYCDPAVCTVSV